MEIIGYKSKYAGRWGVVHYVFYDGSKFYSWEYDIGLLFTKNGKFIIYDSIDKDCLELVVKYKVEDFDMKKYQNLTKDGYNCMEIICYILNMENIKTEKVPTMMKSINKTIVISTLVIIYTICISILFFILGAFYSIKHFTVSEEEYRQNPESIYIQ